MKHLRQPLTRKVIRAYFGPRAKIRPRWFSEGYKIISDTGGEVIVTDDEINIVVGDDHDYRAAVLLGDALWGKITAYGSHESVMSWLAHGEACGVNVRPGIKRGWFWRVIVAAFFIDGLVELHAGNGYGLLIAAIAAFVYWLMAWSARRELQRFAAQVGYSFPRVHGTTHTATNDELEREGWI